MADNFSLGYNINIQSLDEQFGLVEKKEDRSEDIVAVTGEELDTEQAKTTVRQSDQDPYYQVFQRGYQQGKTIQELTSEAADIGTKNDEFATNPDFIIEQALTVNNYDYSAVEARVATNYQIAQEILSDRKFNVAVSQTPFERTMNSVDRFLRDVSPVGTYEAITAKTERQSREILNAATTKSPAEFKIWFEDFADDVAKEGLFAENTLGALEDLTTEVLLAGTDPTKGFNQALVALDIIGAGQLANMGIKGAVKSSMKSSTAVGRVAAVKGSEAASEAAENILKRSPDPEVLNNVGASHIDLAPQPVRPSAAKFTEKFAENEIIKGIDDLFQKGAFGRVADPEAIKLTAKNIAEKYTKKVSNPIFDYKVVDEGLGNYVTNIRFGKASDGTPFKPLPDGGIPQGVQKLADEIKEKVEKAEIVPVDINDPSKGFVIEVTERINISGMPEALDSALGIAPGLVRDTLGRVMNNPVMGSAALRDNQRLATLAQMAESARAAVKQVVKPYEDAIQKLNAKERYTIQAVYTQLRDGADAALRTRYTEGEFAVKYKQIHPNGEAPSPRAYEAYEALASFEEADYLLKTTMMLNRYIEKGYQNAVEVFDGYFAPAKKVRRSDVPDDAKLIDGQYGGKIRIQDIESEEYPIWKLDRPTADGQEYVVTPKTVRVIEPTDVMGYNPGGSRVNPLLNYFVVIGGKRLKSLMGAFSEKQARLAKEQLTNIKKALEGESVSLSSVEKGSFSLPQGVSDWASALQFQKIGASEPSLAPNHFRLYRGEGGTRMSSVQGGRWFTLDLAKAETYAEGGGKVVYLDIDIANRADLLKLTQGAGGVDEVLIDDTALRATAKPLVFKASTKNTSDLDEVIRANNDWNPSIQSVEDLNKFAIDEGWDLSRGEINYKGRNEDILSAEVEGSDIFTGMKIDDYVSNDLRRNDKVLMDFGGGRAYNEDPVNSVLAQFGNSVFTYSNRAYARNAMVGWVKKVKQMERNWFPSDVSPNDYETLFRSAKVSGNDEFARRMKELRGITMRRMNMQDDGASFMEQTGQAIAEFVFDKTGKQLNLGDPSNLLLKIGFQSAFGFTNVSQFFMQGMHATTIMAISPKHGLKGAAMTIPVRAALRANTPEAAKLAVERLAKAADIPVKDAEELVEFIRTSGRAVVDGDAIEDGTGVGFGISGWNGEDIKYSTLSAAGYNISKLVGKGLDIGLYPFKQGERLARLTGINTAFFEFKSKFPGVSALSDEARLWITRREQDLTFNMSSLSRGMVQDGFMRVPTQWLSYTMRSMEQVLVGRNFTAAERARLFTALVPMYGLTGFGLASAADYVAEKMGIEPDSSLYIGLKYGMLDALIDALPGDVEIGLGQRLAPVGAITDTYKKIFEEKTITALGGPSGEIAGGIFTATMDALTSLRHGHTATLTDDMVKILRQPSGLDNIAKAIGIFNNGVYRSKNGIAIDSEMSIGDGIVALTGFTPLEVVENYSRLSDVYNSGKKFSDFRKEVNRDAERIFMLMQGDRADVERAIKLTNELHARIAMSGFPTKDMMSLRRSATQRIESNWVKIQDNLIQQDKTFALQAARSILKGDE